MPQTEISQLQLREIQARTLLGVYGILRMEQGEEAALDIIRRTVEEDAGQAGQAFARSAPDGPSLAHFSTVLDRWKGSSALDIEDIELHAGELSFTVVRCGYVEAYRAMGVPRNLAYVLSCFRDAAFARGYMPDLVLERSRTIAQGNSHCRFSFMLPGVK